MSNLSVTAIAHPIVDVVVHVNEKDFAQLEMGEAPWARCSDQQQQSIFDALSLTPKTIASGGSGANAIEVAQRLGFASGFQGAIGEDSNGRIFLDRLLGLGVLARCPTIAAASTGSCISVVRESGERTMRTSHGAAALFDEGHVDGTMIAKSDWLMIQGYFFSASAENQRALAAAIKEARLNDTKIAFCLSAQHVASAYRAEIWNISQDLEMLISNEEEAMAFAQCNTFEGAAEALREFSPIVVITRGSKGSYLRVNGQDFDVPAFESNVVDLTGAGDVYAGALIAGLSDGLPPDKAARGAARLAAMVISHDGARIKGDPLREWEASIS